MRLTTWLLVLLLGCAGPQDFRGRFPGVALGPTGTLVLLMSQPASDVSVAINGTLVVEAAHTQHLVIDGVPGGSADVIMTANGSDKQFRVWIDDEHATTVPLGVPDGGASFLKTLAGTLITILVYSWLHH